MAGREDGKKSSPSAEIEAEDGIFPVVQAGLGGGSGARCQHWPGCSTMKRKSLVVRHQAWKWLPCACEGWNRSPSSSPRDSGAGDIHRLPGASPIRNPLTGCEDTNDSSSTTKTSVTSQRIIWLPKIALWHASTCNVVCNTPGKGGVGNSPQQTCTFPSWAMLLLWISWTFMPGCLIISSVNSRWITMPGELLGTHKPCSSREQGGSTQRKGRAGKIGGAKLSQKRSKVSVGAQDRRWRGANVCT